MCSGYGGTRGSEKRFVGELGEGELRRDPTLAQDKNAVCKHTRLFYLRRCEKNAKSLSRKASKDTVDLHFSHGIDAAGWFVEQKKRGRTHHATGDERLLLIATGERRDRQLQISGSDVQLAGQFPYA